jgi:iron complex outermembrane recepter protein
VTALKYVHARNCFDMPLPLVPPFKLQEALRYNIGLTQIQLEYDFAAAQNRVNPDYGDRATPAYHLLNLRASRNFSVKQGIFQIGAACENILDSYYREHLDIGAVPRFGRNFSFNVSFIF